MIDKQNHKGPLLVKKWLRLKNYDLVFIFALLKVILIDTVPLKRKGIVSKIFNQKYFLSPAHSQKSLF